MSTQSISHQGNPSVATTRGLGLNARRRDFARGTLLVLVGLAFAGVAQTARAVIPPSERQVLVDIYTSTNGAAWATNTGWNDAVGTECTWYGIICDGAWSHVTNIQLEANHLIGTLPALTGLPSLAQFTVTNNQLTGSLPTLTGLTNLWDFEVALNHFTGPIPDLTGLTSLLIFYAANNQLSGSIPVLTGSANLQQFEVYTNQLTGPIPDLTGLTNLWNFRADTNQLTGPIPALTQLTSLAYFYVNNNQLSGPLPTLTGLTNLQIFHVGNNRLSGPVPATPASLVAASLCANLLDTTPGANDPGWNTATGHTPWWATPYANSRCDDIFTDGFEG